MVCISFAGGRGGHTICLEGSAALEDHQPCMWLTSVHLLSMVFLCRPVS
jgi:hypothetical protein